MQTNQWMKWLLIAVMTVMMTACGGGGGGGSSAADQAVAVFRAYAQNPTTAEVPDANDYDALDVVLNGHTIDEINRYIAQLGNPDAVDSKAELDAIAAALGVTILDTDGDGIYDAFDADIDGDGTSNADEAINGTDPLVNTKPVADAGEAQTLDEGRTVALNASASEDVDSAEITYLWHFTAKPIGSMAVLSDATVVAPTFLADKPGEYRLELVVNDGNSNSDPSSATVSILGTLLFARHTVQNGYEPWITNGTSEGTRQLLNINQTPNSSKPEDGVRVGEYIYFTTSSERTGMKIWRTDGSLDGTIVVEHNASYHYRATLANFQNRLHVTYNRKLWKLNDDHNALVEIGDFASGYIGRSLDMDSGVTYFSTYARFRGSSIWKLSASGLELILPESNSYHGELVLSSGKIYFADADIDHGNELRVLDPATDVVSMVEDVRVGTDSAAPNDLVDVDGRIYFSISAAAGANRTLARLNDAGDGIDVSSSDLNPEDLVYFDNLLYFSGEDDRHGRELRRRMPDDSFQVLELVSGSDTSDVRDLKVVNGKLYFMAKEHSLCTFDTSESEAVEIKDMGGDIYNLIADDSGKLYFHVGVGGLFSPYYDLWSSDGSSDGTVLIEEHYIGGSSGMGGGFLMFDPRPFLFLLDNQLIFPDKDQSHGKELWSSNGDVGAAQMLKDLDDTDQSSTWRSNDAYSLKIGFIHYFVPNDSDGKGLWSSDGVETIKLLGDENTTVSSKMVDVNGILYFVASTKDNGTEIWKSDGTVAGTVEVTMMETENASPRDLIAVDDVLYFTATEAGEGRELWKIHGDSIEMITDMADNYGVDICCTGGDKVVNAAGVVYFAVENFDNSNIELWKMDNEGIRQWSHFDVSHTDMSHLAVVGDIVYFFADDGTHGVELWKTTATGVEIVADMSVGAESSLPYASVSHEGKLYFYARIAGNNDLWSYDGTGLIKVQSDVLVGQMRSVGDTLYFTSGYTVHKGQLWKVQDGESTMVKDLHDSDTTHRMKFYGDISGNLILGGKAFDDLGYPIWSSDKLWSSDGTTTGTTVLYPHETF